jgi:serpin B
VDTCFEPCGLPKFSFEDALLDGKTVLGALGMNAAFDPSSADFSGMDGLHDLFIQFVMQRAIISVDEQGTVATAVTFVGCGGGGYPEPPPPPPLIVDRPFLFFLRERATGTILFMGRVVAP